MLPPSRAGPIQSDDCPRPRAPRPHAPRTSSPPWWRRGTVYRVYARSFADGDGDGVGDLRGLRAHLDHLTAKHVQAVWLSPVSPSPMADLGYDVADYCDVDPLFGTLDDLDGLVADCPVRGLRVLLDWVPDHSSDRHPWFLASVVPGVALVPGGPEARPVRLAGRHTGRRCSGPPDPAVGLLTRAGPGGRAAAGIGGQHGGGDGTAGGAGGTHGRPPLVGLGARRPPTPPRPSRPAAGPRARDTPGPSRVSCPSTPARRAAPSPAPPFLPPGRGHQGLPRARRPGPTATLEGLPTPAGTDARSRDSDDLPRSSHGLRRHRAGWRSPR
ncbi:alpha-amylase family glycosyl hydrolase [Geodermatophilus maliterrae]|uniref:Alpha-amylase family glycosyl hydrolase n=1 Tax=Geodermatophilus maliterrae TaxID=3162531 RepID=A0ABV3XET5_9ACTN